MIPLVSELLKPIKVEFPHGKNYSRYPPLFKSFPVIILACSNYIQNNDNIREIDKIFGVTYDGDDVGRFLFNKGNWFYTHHDANGRKLVIHTRQLSADVKDDMLKEMAKIIKKHLERHV